MQNFPGAPPGFSGSMRKSLPPNTAPVFIPDGPGVKIMHRYPFYNHSPVIATSAPAETLPCVDMLLNSSTERRSLSPLRKMDGTQLNRSRVLSCSDLESVLTSKQHNGSRLYHTYQPSAPDFRHLPPIQSGSPIHNVPHHVPQLMSDHNLQPLLPRHHFSGQEFTRMMQAHVRPPPGFNIPLLTHSKPIADSPYGSPQPWSPARLAPLFGRDESPHRVMTKVDSKTDSETSRETTYIQGESYVGRNVNTAEDKRYEEHRSDSAEESSNAGPSALLVKEEDIEPWERALKSMENKWPCGMKTAEESDSHTYSIKKKEKPRKKKKQNKKSAESASGLLTEGTLPDSKEFVHENETDELGDSCLEESGLIESLSPHSIDDTSVPPEIVKEKLKKLKRKKKQKVEQFENYWSLDQVNNGLADKTLIEGEIRINQRNYKEAYVTDPESGQDIIILGLKDRNRSLEGDIVVVKLKEESELQKQKKERLKHGKVVYLKEQVHHRCTVGTLHIVDKGMILLVPRDQRFPLLKIQPQSIPVNLLENLSSPKLENIMFKATILSWEITRYACGIIEKKVGKKGDLVSETAAIFEELGIDAQPVPDLKNYLPPLPYQISEEEILKRLDLRSEVIFTIDPPMARDLDDAVSIKKLSDDTFEVGVHISDVSFFLQEGTLLDKIVSERATTVYMVEEVCHMLPISMCNLCSLNPGEDKLAMSVLMTIHRNGTVLERTFKRSVIHSCAQLSYDEVQDVIEGKDVEISEIHNNVGLCDIKQAILLLNDFAIHFRKKRFEGGALKIDQPKLWFTLDVDSMPNSLAVYEIKDSHRLIEEFMLLANESVARFIHEKAPDIALLRRHDQPKEDMMDRLVKSLNEMGINLDSSSAGNLHASLSKYCDDELRASVLYHLCARPMKRAMYFCSSDQTHHYALNMEKYTHFTSPIRRYADIVVHRVLAGCLDLAPMPPWDAEQVTRFASICNKKKFTAKRANEMSCDLFRTMYVKKVGSLTVDAIVVSVSARSFNVLIPSLAYNTKISLERMEDVKFEFVDKDMNSEIKIIWPADETVQDIKMFSCIQVLLICCNNKGLSPQIQAIPLPPPKCPS